MEKFINPIVYLFEVLTVYTYISDIFERKFSTLKTILIGCSIFTVPYILNELANHSMLNTFAIFAATALFIRLTNKANLLQSLLHSLIIICIMLGTELVCFYSVSLIYDDNSFYAYRDSTEVYIFDAITSKLLFLLVCKVCSQFKLKNKSKAYKAPFMYYVFGITSCFMLVVFILINSQYKFDSSLQTLLIIGGLLLLFTSILQFISHEKAAVKNAEYLELQKEKQRQKIDTDYYRLLEIQNSELHRFSHDTKHHLSAILNLSDNKDVEEYINIISKDLEKYSPTGKTGNKILDVIIHKYSLLSESKGIAFETEIMTANLSYIDSPQLSSLLGNILDNAIEAAEKCKEPKILLSINKNDNFDVLCCVNSCSKSPSMKGDRLLTTKEDKELHGFGTKSIEKIVKLYNGTHSFKYDEKLNEFTFTAIFPHIGNR